MKEKCHNHPENDALTFCHSCGRPFCFECLSEGVEYYYCHNEQCQNALQSELNKSKESEAAKPFIEDQYPTILRRYLSTFIDGMFIIFVFIAASYIFRQENELARMLRIGIGMAMFFIYEPLCTSKLCTLGQKVMGIRVRKHLNHERISIPSAYARIIVKLFLGLISFFTIPFTKGKRAIHDFAAGSIVIYHNSH